tara:strand:- start:2713 stop:3897 length:1185 start_codon:yes stop_codon:yes gene_type:complete
MSLPFSNIKVVELSHAVMGPSAGLFLADMGAQVTRVEPLSGDPTRFLKGFGVGYYPFYNRNKKIISTDLKKEEGKKIVIDLIKKSDVVIENFGPGTIDRLGLGYEDLKEENPELIFCSLKGFLPGPYEKRHAMDEIVQMMGGLAYMTGPSGQPLRAGASVIDISGGMFAAMGIITALYERESSGKGKFVQSSLYETCAFIMGQHMAYASQNNDSVPPMPERVSAWSIYRVFNTKDEDKVFIGVISEKHWASFCDSFDRADWEENENYSTNNKRIEHRDTLLKDIEDHILTLTKEEVIAICEKAHIPFAPINRPEDLFEDPHLNQGSYGLVETEFPNGVKTKMPRTPILYGDAKFDNRLNPAKSIGEHTIEILKEIGYKSEEIEKLKEEEIINYE